MGADLTNNALDAIKDRVVNEKKLRLSKKRKSRIEDFSPRVMTSEEIRKEKIDRYQLVL
ncbi:hypothetical protein [Parvicella tangerina]|uniref:Uncharacterized protein n=1 Tax=Parvicella tangerina TaxID=2829795 RepID=A0A916JND8_9FLAO|nr:hypothetical protein [Parvicella tangerina]CAG5083263.1 hypothetical protein CRYO30217_02142 [Parvicella tangerina]